MRVYPGDQEQARKEQAEAAMKAIQATKQWSESDVEEQQYAPLSEQIHNARVRVLELTHRIDVIRAHLAGATPIPPCPTEPDPLDGGFIKSLSVTNSILEMLVKNVGEVQRLMGER